MEYMHNDEISTNVAESDIFLSMRPALLNGRTRAGKHTTPQIKPQLFVA